MKKSVLTIGISAFILGLSLNNFALSSIGNYSIATVDVSKIVASSSKVNALKSEQAKKRNELIEFVKKARADVAQETDKTKQKALEDKYNQQLNSMKNANDEEYQKKLGEIDSNISKIINEKAKANNYDIVLSKNIVLYGGKDITDEVAKAVK